MSNEIKRFKEDLQLAGYAKRSIQSYTSAVLRLQRFYNKPLEDITEEQLRQHWLCCQNEFGWSAATLRISYSGIQYFFTRTLVRSWNIFNDIKWKREQTLPTILSLEEVRKIIYALPTVQSHTFYLTLYSMGLRLREATTLQVKDILSDRGLVYIHGGKNAQYAKDHVSDSGVQGILRTTLKRLKFKKHVHPHVFRHAYATHLLEANIPLRHASVSSTFAYNHSRQDLFVHTKPLEIIFKAKFKGGMKKAGLLDKIDPAVWKQQWVIDSQAAGQGQNSLRYLSRYVFRVAISNNRIKSIENDVIKFLYKDRAKKKWKPMVLSAIT